MDGLLQDDLFGIITVGYAELLAEALHRAVLSDDVDALNRLLKEPTADINGLKYGDNLLVTAIKRERQEAAIWLVEHGIDADFETCHLVLHEPEKPLQQQQLPPQDTPSTDDAPTAASNRRIARQSSRIAIGDAAAAGARRGGGGGGRQQQQQQQQLQPPPPPPPDLYSITCRQLAYEMQLWKVVSAIDARKGANMKAMRRYPDMRLYRRQRQDSAIGAPAAADRGGDAADGPADSQKEADRVPQAVCSDDSEKDEGDEGEAVPVVQAPQVVESFASPARSFGEPRRCRLLGEEEEEEQRLLMSPTTITWRRSTLTKSAKLRQRLERRLCAAAEAVTGAYHSTGGCCAAVSSRAAAATAADEAHGATQPLVVGACACQLNKELSRLLTAAASAASAVGGTPRPRPRTVGRPGESKAFSHPSVRRSQSSGRRATDQPSAA